MMLSVITIAYNNLKGLKNTLEVFEKGNFTAEIENVIVDGNSTDGTKEFLNSQTLSNNWISENDKGIYNAMNKGLLMAKGEYVWFLNSGDYAFSNEVVRDVLLALKDKPDAVYGETMMVDAEGRHVGTRSEIGTRKLPFILNWNSFRMGMNVGHQSFVIKRSLALPYNENYKYVADIDWMISCLKQCNKIVRLDKVVACFALDGFSTENRSKSNWERYKVLQKHYGILPNLFNHLMIIFRKLFRSSGL